jgi:RNA polymerase sigma-70 factor (ECF subfamily)
MDSNSNQLLIRNIQLGDSKALKHFFESFYPSVCIFARKYIKDMDVAEDIAQESFMEFWRRREQFYDLKALKGFIYTVARNKCLNQIKLSSIREDILRNQLFSDDFFYEMVQEEETYRILHQAINGLANQSKRIILLSLKGYKNSEIAEELDISVNTVKTLKKNAYKELRSKLQDHVFLLFLLNQMLH